MRRKRFKPFMCATERSTSPAMLRDAQTLVAHSEEGSHGLRHLSAKVSVISKIGLVMIWRQFTV